MIGLHLPSDGLDVLCLGAHPDDIEIGCGGTLLALGARERTTVRSAVLTGSELRAEEARNAARAFGVTDLALSSLPDGRLPAHWAEVKQTLEDLATGPRPDVVLAPRPDDSHQDHRLIAELVSTTWRDSLVLHYEIPKWDGDLSRATHYVPLTAEQAHRKVELLHDSFVSQKDRDWWDDETFLGLMRLRGIECRAPYAEAFTAPKVLLDLRRP
ncbi:PIG-L deacetylase family protein [Nocardioides sp. YIM 152315]|uniref:PIG-L deacetylase family protein n=1 Tax=Nocardioides sp. YIM 152315 TaxID=3031760 RepID=UPI0023DABBBA|nr:PIG-L deacetylase family protein [Nocardioides sp. YIM 152315]MDF1603457.1 PIG-L family deacetylase [Nocardioides sp. YIM 152315]